MTWRDSAACRNFPPDTWFDADPAAGPEDPWAIPKRVCRACAVTTRCLTTALDDHEQWGVWGGLDPEQRRRLTGDTP